MTRPRPDGRGTLAPAPDLAITFLRSLAPPQRQAFVSRMRQPAFAAKVRAVEALVDAALVTGARAGGAALARSMAARLVSAVGPADPLLLRFAAHAVRGGTRPAPPWPGIVDADADAAGPARAEPFAVQLALELERASADPPTGREAGAKAVTARSAHAARRVGPRRQAERTPPRQ